MSIYLNIALEYAARGWPIIPIGKDKKPALKQWAKFQTVRPTEAELKLMFDRSGITGLAVICGAISGNLVCRDFDVAGRYEAWAKEYPEMAALLPTVKTGRGYHVYFRSRGRTKTKKQGDGELRGNLVYCVLPPSRHPNGASYKWIVQPPDGDLPEVDPVEIGLAPVLQRRQRTTETTEAIPSVLSALSVFSVTPAIESRIRQAIEKTLPHREGEREGLVFKLARALKGIPEVADLPVASCRPIVRRWHDAAYPVIGTKPFENTWEDFIRGWDRVRHPLGADVLRRALEWAKKMPPPPEATLYDDSKTHLLINVCRALQIYAGKNPFFLSCYKAGELIGVTHTKSNGLLSHVFVADGVLEVAIPGTEYKATRYRYLGDLGSASEESGSVEISNP